MVVDQLMESILFIYIEKTGFQDNLTSLSAEYGTEWYRVFSPSVGSSEQF